jgi:glycosyltransferase involved in cell wall biosynthesis
MFDRVIVVNQLERKILNDDAKVRVIPCGVNFAEFRPTSQADARRALDLPLDKPLVLWAGEYWQWAKRFELVEASIEALQRRLADVELVMVSGKPHSVIPTYMNACDALVLTSRSEGSPMVIKEAMACNLPIVSTDVGDVAEVIQGVEGCYLVHPTPQDVADKLYKVLKERRRTRGRDRIRHLSSDSIAQQIIAVYNALRSAEGRSQ